MTEDNGTNSTTTSSGSKGNKNPPLLSKCKSYEDWKKKIKVWDRITCLTKEARGGAMNLEGEAEDAVLELSEE